MNEVYEVCQRLKAAGFPQDITKELWWLEGKGGGRHLAEGPTLGSWTDYYEGHGNLLDFECACPNSDECLTFARARWPSGAVTIHSIAVGPSRPPKYVAAFTGPPHGYAEHADPAQACRLALAAALEAEL